MQILFISEEAEVLKFLSGLQAEAIMAQGDVEIRGMSAQSMVTVICSGVNDPFYGMLTSVDKAYSNHSLDGKWLSVKFMVRRITPMGDFDLDHPVIQ